ncbi:cyanophycinase [Rubrivirga marina]|uniref:Cyanophycinase n=1 Tax=Rubrivirga marina TaxID=1196024 RepID=A0A271IZR4_9BACT|nr:cyanophycinase [Rubrivirga marina]PAP76703.1 cyanophycinase [Rubrivirga marina]
MPSPETDAPRGPIIPIGGAEAKTGTRDILTRVLALAGGPDARIAVIPTASELADTGDRYAKLFHDLGAAHVDVLEITEREHAHVPGAVETVERATGIFMTGGNQLRLSTILGGTPLAQAIRRQNAAGTVVAGTSAGAAVIPEHMIAAGATGPTPTTEKVTLAPGMGLTNRLVIDQHFRQRDRLGRLLTAVSYNPFATGVGIDEDTALVLGPDNVFEVIGSGTVTVVDPSELTYSSMDSARRNQPVSLIGLRVHVLAAGCTYDTEARTAAAPARVPYLDEDEDPVPDES